MKETPADTSVNADPAELERFGAMAADWWDPDGSSRPLHDLNPVRLNYLGRFMGLDGQRIVDIGCGGGLLSEAMARQGATVVGLELAEESLRVAREHASVSELTIDYQGRSAEALAVEAPQSFDAVVCMEMLEHVPQPESIIAASATLIKPGGWVFFSTLNRTARAFALGIVAAEYVLGLLPRGTHTYRQFIRPSELAGAAREAGLVLCDVSGIAYNPFSRVATLTRSPSVNYIAAFRHA